MHDPSTRSYKGFDLAHCLVSSPSMSAATEPQYNISGALRYLDAVKAAFADSPESYDAFLQIMTDFRNEV